MKHVKTISRGPAPAVATLALLLDFFVVSVQVVTAWIFQKNGGSL